MNGILGKKIRMTNLFSDSGEYIPVTVVEAGPCYITQIKNAKKDGYSAVQLGFVEKREKVCNKPRLGLFKKSGLKPQGTLREFRLEKDDDSLNLGGEIKVDIFNPGDVVSVSGKTKGKGFQGVVKRHNFAGGQRTHGQSDRERAPGSVGQSSYPSRVIKGMKMGGRMGGKKVTTRNLEIVRVIPEKNILMIKGAVPGAPNSILEIKRVS